MKWKTLYLYLMMNQSGLKIIYDHDINLNSIKQNMAACYEGISNRK